MIQLPSETLVELAGKGDREAFNELYRRFYPPVVKRLTHLTGPAGPVGDLVQETFIQAYRNLGRFRGQSPIGHWLLRIATNVARSFHRRARRQPWKLWDRPEVESAVPSPAGLVDETYPTLQALHEALSHLSPPLREAVILFELEGMSLAEMSLELNIPLHTTASRVRRGRKQLRKALERLGFGPIVQAEVALCPGDPS